MGVNGCLGPGGAEGLTCQSAAITEHSSLGGGIKELIGQGRSITTLLAAARSSQDAPVDLFALR